MLTDIDYREKKYRQLGFDKFYQAHVETNDCSPDIAVETWIADNLNFDYEKRCVMALFHGATYAGPCETMFSDKFPVFKPEVLPEMIKFFQDNKKRLLFSADCKYRKMVFEKFLESVSKSIERYGTLGNTIRAQMTGLNYASNYISLQKFCMDEWYHWGRMGHWCFAEALHRFIKAPIEPPTMEFGPTGKSHTSGWAFCVGLDDFVSKMDNDQTLSNQEVKQLEETASLYLEHFRYKHPKLKLATFFTLETACCNYKRQFKGSRYGLCYIDEQHTEIIQMKRDWSEYNWLWDKYLEGRQAVIPASLLFENFKDVSDRAYCDDWTDALKKHGRMPRVEAWHNKSPQRWCKLDDLGFSDGNDIMSFT